MPSIKKSSPAAPGKSCRVKLRTRSHKKRKGFCKKKKLDEDDDIDLDIRENHDISQSTSSSSSTNTTDNNNVTMDTSVSSRKIEEISTPYNPETVTTGYRLIDMELLATMFSSLMCPECMTCTLSLQELASKKRGLASYLCVSCTSYGHKVNSYTSKTNKGMSFDVNKRVVYAMRECGQGYSSLDTF